MSRTVATLNFVEKEMCGAGGATYPRLLMRLIISYPPLPGQKSDFFFRQLNAQLHVPNWGKISDALPVSLASVQRSNWEDGHDDQIMLEFPLDAMRVAKLEEIRNGGNLQLELHACLCLDRCGAVAEGKGAGRPPASGVIWLETPKGHSTLSIAKSIWIERVLPQVGYGAVHVIELPAVPVSSCEALDLSFKALKQAEEKHRLGFYDDAVGKCRVAMEQFFDYIPANSEDREPRKIPVLKKSWETRLGQATYEWLSEALGAVKQAANVAHHSPNTHYDQFEAQMLIAITTTLVAYAARSLDTPKERVAS